ncbi:amino acid adenylation domain-containing protein [Clostridium ihumii]|uniref:amino acid adenylation domain-containing protein n=1 Tax=Clostridium ihumii TaxID=1470356 RepID=UPI003D32495A
MEFSYEKLLLITMEVLEYNNEHVVKKDNLIELGLTSLGTMKIINRFREHGIKISFSELMKEPYLETWWEIIKSKLKVAVIEKSPRYESCEDSLFPLTDVQQAYWIGRDENQILGGVSCHIYFEFKCININEEQLKLAWNKVQKKHPMLRVKILENGMQIINDNSYRNNIIIHDLRGFDKENRNEKLEKIRYENSHRVLDIKNGQVAELELSMIDERNSIIHFDIDVIVADLKSFRIIFSDLCKYYKKADIEEIDYKKDFSHYIFDKNYISCDEKSREFWNEKIKSVTNGPQLPYCTLLSSISNQRFKRRNYILDKEKWDILCNSSKKIKVTPAMVFLTLLSKVLDRYSESEEFFINIPIFNRPIEYKDIVGDFTNIVLLPLNNTYNKGFLEDIKIVKDNFLEIMSFSNYSGINVIRDIKKNNKGNGVIAPVVFSCDYEDSIIDYDFQQTFGDIDYISSQTPQVTIDFQIMKVPKGIMLSWDAIDEAFNVDVIENMFEDYINTLEWLLKNPSRWNEKLPDINKEKLQYRYKNIINENTTDMNFLHKKVFENGKINPSKIAVIEAETNTEISYEKLTSLSKRMATWLKSKDIGRNDKVAIRLPRGANQIVAILAVLSIGACYVPININQPKNRTEKIISKSGAKILITNEVKDISEEDIPLIILNSQILQYEELDCIEEYDSEDSAYIIFTSGTTGEPKGVEISHKSAWNTIEDVNMKCAVNENDKLLSVSSLEFDLSVYDIFGVLSQCGTVVLINEGDERRSDNWVKYMKKYDITLWNSVPFLLEMLISNAKEQDVCMNTLRKVLLSGDWIGIDLPARLKLFAPNASILAMGGATEASIWSNYFEIEKPLPKNWISIPYGQPLKNQAYRVVDSKGRDCPNWVSGELWIGGQGVAKGYVGDNNLTESKFKYFRERKWYKTGDMGRFWSDGTLEFLGRKDTQVKIKGHRIELSEIENVLEKMSGITKCIVCTVGGESNKKLATYIAYENNQIIKENDVKEFLNLYLPEYMIPKAYYFSNDIPTSKNGKINRKKVYEVLSQKALESNEYVAPKGELEEKITDIWKKILSVDKVSRFDNFFEIGGDSLKAINLISQLKNISIDPLSLSIQLLFQSPTIESLTKEIEKINREIEVNVI